MKRVSRLTYQPTMMLDISSAKKLNDMHETVPFMRRNFGSVGSKVQTQKQLEPMRYNIYLHRKRIEQQFSYRILKDLETARSDPLVSTLPKYIAPVQREDPLILSSYLKGDIDLRTFVHLRTFNQTYKKIVDEVEKPMRHTMTGSQSKLLRLKRRIVERAKQQQESRPALLEFQPIRPIKEPKDNRLKLADKIKQFIIDQQDFASSSKQKKFNQSLRNVKMINELNTINENYIEKIKQKDLNCTVYNKPYFTRKDPQKVVGSDMLLLKEKRLKDRRPLIGEDDYNAIYQLAAKEFSENLSPKIDIETPTPDKKQTRVHTTTYIPQSQYSIQVRRTTTDRTLSFNKSSSSLQRVQISMLSDGNVSTGKLSKVSKVTQKLGKRTQTEQDQECLLHESDQSDHGSLQSLFEVGIDQLYHQSIQLQKQILGKDTETFVKRIRQLQKLNELNSKTIKVNQNKLEKVK